MLPRLPTPEKSGKALDKATSSILRRSENHRCCVTGNRHVSSLELTSGSPNVIWATTTRLVGVRQGSRTQPDVPGCQRSIAGGAYRRLNKSTSEGCGT